MKYFLNAKDIDEASNEAESYLRNQNVAIKDIMRIRLGVEDILLRYQEHFNENTEFVLRFTKFLGSIKAIISVKGDVFDPYSGADDDNETNAFMRRAMYYMGNTPIWKYAHGSNTVSFYALKKTLPSWASILIAIVLAVIFGVALNFVPQNISSFICEEIIAPLMDCFMNIIKSVSSPMICLAVIWGMYSMGDTTLFGLIGKKFTRRLLIYFNILVAFAGAVSLALFPLRFGTGQQNFTFKQIYSMILGILPPDIVTPFANGNTLQVFFIGMVIGLALLVAGDRSKTISSAIEELSGLVQMIMGFIGRLVPYFVFGSMLNLVVLSDFKQLSSSYMFVIANLLVGIINAIVMIIITSVKLKISPKLVCRKIAPATIIAFSTDSSSAALAEIITSCTDRCGINRGFTNFGAPLSQVTFKSGTAMLYIISAFYVASIYGVEISVSWCITALIVCVILGVATPPVTGGTAVAFSVLFTQMNLPVKYLAIILTIGTLIDFFSTALNVLNVQCQMLLSANSFKYIDREILETE